MYSDSDGMLRLKELRIVINSKYSTRATKVTVENPIAQVNSQCRQQRWDMK
jgi:hypothetical protein